MSCITRESIVHLLKQKGYQVSENNKTEILHARLLQQYFDSKIHTDHIMVLSKGLLNFPLLICLTNESELVFFYTNYHYNEPIIHLLTFINLFLLRNVFFSILTKQEEVINLQEVTFSYTLLQPNNHLINLVMTRLINTVNSFNTSYNTVKAEELPF